VGLTAIAVGYRPAMTLPLRDARAVVTGGAGFVGSWMCDRLVDEGARVTCVDSLVTGRTANVSHLVEHERFRLVEADVSEGIPDVGRVDLVLHLASPASPVHYHRLPVETLRVGSEGTRHALELADRHGARFLLASSSEVYGDPAEHPQPESYRGSVDPTGPRSMYDEAKRFGEALTAAYREDRGTNTAIARIFNTYGPRMDRDDGRVVPTLIRQALAGEPLTVAGDGSQTRSLCWIEDTVEGLLQLVVSDEPGPVNIGNDDEWTIAELAEAILDITGSDSTVQHVALPVDDPKVRRPDLTLARQSLGWSPEMPVCEGLRRTVEWFAEQESPASLPAG
jgi:dTDP-glucose 4,6-dehydratase